MTCVCVILSSLYSLELLNYNAMWDRGGQGVITLNQKDNLHADLVLLGIYPQVHGTFNIPLPRKATCDVVFPHNEGINGFFCG